MQSISHIEYIGLVCIPSMYADFCMPSMNLMLCISSMCDMFCMSSMCAPICISSLPGFLMHTEYVCSFFAYRVCLLFPLVLSSMYVCQVMCLPSICVMLVVI